MPLPWSYSSTLSCGISSRGEQKNDWYRRLVVVVDYTTPNKTTFKALSSVNGFGGRTGGLSGVGLGYPIGFLTADFSFFFFFFLDVFRYSRLRSGHCLSRNSFPARFFFLKVCLILMRGLDAAVVATEKNSMYVRLAKIWRIWRARNSRHGGGGVAASLLPENVQFDPNLMSWVKLLLLLLLLLFLSSIRLDYLFKVVYIK